MASGGPLSGAKFLVLSGDAVARDLIAVLLKHRGYRDTVVADPNEVDAVLGSQKFLAVFADARPLHAVADFQALIARLGKDTKLVLLVDEGGMGGIDEATAGKTDAVLPYPFEDAMVERVLKRLARTCQPVTSASSKACRRRRAMAITLFVRQAQRSNHETQRPQEPNL